MFEARERGDVAQVLALMHPDIVATTAADGQTYRGVEEAAGYFAALEARGDRVEVRAQRVVADGERVRVHGRVRTISHGRLVDSPAAWTFTVRDGLVTAIAPLASA